MPSQPPDPYSRDFDFEQFSQLTPNAQQPGQEINQELDSLAGSVNQTISRLNEIQRDDGKLRDGIFDFTPMNNAVIEAQSARDDAVAAKVEAVAAKDYITVTASGLEASVALTAAAANASKNLALYHANQAGTYATQAEVSKIAAANSASSAAATATNAMNFSASASNSAAAAAGSATSAANSLTSITTGLLSKLTNSINWTGAYDNGVTYQAGDGVIFGGEYFVLKAYIGAAGYDPAAYASSWTKLIPAGVGGNPFDQSLNTTDTVQFNGLSLVDTSSNTGVFNQPNRLELTGTNGLDGGVYVTGSNIALSLTNGTTTVQMDLNGVTFPDATVQTTAAQTFDQSLNTTDTVNFNQLNTLGSLGSFVAANDYTSLVGQSIQSYGSVGTLTISADQGITFADSTVQTTAAIPLPAVAGVDGQILSTDGVNPVWVDNSARTLFSAVRNETGATLAKGTVVYINGASGNKATVAKAQANGDATSATTFAVVSADIANNNNGTAIVVGELTGLDTSAYAEGAALYLSPTVAGGFTATKPNAPDHIVYVATVTRSHANQGIIEVRIQNGYELDELHNVQAQAPNDGDSIFYDSSDQQWKTASVVSKVPEASDTVAGKVELATSAEAIDGTSTTLAVTPAASMAVVNSQRIDTQVFGSPTTSGAYTWTKPDGAKFVEIYLFSGGGGGASGSRNATTVNRGGGGGGAGGTTVLMRLFADELSEVVSGVVGAGGNGAPSQLTDTSAGINGSNGGDTTFGNYRAAFGAPGVGAILNGTGSAGATKSGLIYGANLQSGGGGIGTTGTVPLAAASGSVPLAAKGGSGGAGQAANVLTQINGTVGGAHVAAAGTISGYSVAVAGGVGGTNAIPDGGDGVNSPILLGTGTGGGSGAYRTANVGGSGGDGGWPSGGGGGGSGSDNGFASGAGGKGANGKVVVITYF